MKNRFVKITLALTMLLVVAVPAQAFAADNCSFNQFSKTNIQMSKIYGQLPQSAVNNLQGVLAQYSSGKIDAAQLQSICKELGLQMPAITAPAKPTVPAQPAAPTPAPAKPTTPTAPAPVKPSTPAAPTTPAAPAPVKPSTPAAPTTPAAPAQPTAPSSSIGAYEQQVVDLVNKERAAAGLPALKVNTKLSAVAEKKAEDMRDRNYFSHTSPTYGSPFDMMKQFGISYTTAGENIAKGQKTPAAVMNGWMNSEGHRANILNSKYTEIGVGYVTDSNGNTYWVQHFIRP